MIVRSDNHVHSKYSRNGHAKGELEEVVCAAREIGLKEIIITDHGPGHILFGVKRTKFKEIRAEIDRLNTVYEDINILMGCEANVVSYSGEIDLKPDELELLDRVNVGFHYGIVPKDLNSIITFMILNPVSKLFKPLQSVMIQRNTDALIKIINNYNIDIITHPGLKARVDIKRLAGACSKRGTALEINSSHGKLDEEDIMIAMNTDVRFSLGSDAHHPKRVGDLKKSTERVVNCGVPKDRIINLVE